MWNRVFSLTFLTPEHFYSSKFSLGGMELRQCAQTFKLTFDLITKKSMCGSQTPVTASTTLLGKIRSHGLRWEVGMVRKVCDIESQGAAEGNQ